MGHLRLRRPATIVLVALLAPVVASTPALATGGDGGVIAFGQDYYGQLGDGGIDAERSYPVPSASLGPGSGVVAVAAGRSHSLAVRGDGSALAWGADYYGQLGDGGGDFDKGVPVGVSGMGPGSGTVAVAAGQGHSLALRADGSVLAWGWDVRGQLGDGGENVWAQSTPVPVNGLGPGSGVVAVAAGGTHSLALRADGSVVAWGDDSLGQLGDGGAAQGAFQSTPVPVSGLGAGSGVVAVAAGTYHSLALRSDGSVLAWGYDGAGQLGDGDGPSYLQATPVAVSGLGPGSGVVQVSAAVTYSLALRSDGSVLTWGTDFGGHVGPGGEIVPGTMSSTPVGVSGLGPGSGVVALAVGPEAAHSLAARADGSLLAWGNDQTGQLGDGGDNEPPEPTPVAVRGLGPGSGVVAMAVGGGFSLALSVAQGYALAGGDGGVFSFGAARFSGSAGGVPLSRPVVGIEHTATTYGYWLAASDGGVFAYGDARFLGSTGGMALRRPVVGIERTASGNGYWLVAADGGVFAFGDAVFRGSTGGMKLRQPIVGMERTASGEGYWLVAADGGIFAFGDAPFRGSAANLRLKRPIVGMSRSESGGGYHLVAADGGVFTFGDAAFHGSAATVPMLTVVGIMATASGKGYWLCGRDGSVRPFGDARDRGSLTASALNGPIVGCDPAVTAA